MKKHANGGHYWDNASGMRKLTDSATVHLQYETGKYPALDLVSKISADLMYATWIGAESIYSLGDNGISEIRLKRFMERMDIPNAYGMDLIDENVACYEDREAIIPVRATDELRKRSKDDKTYHIVTIRNLCEEGDSAMEKLRSLEHIEADCTCIRTTVQKTCRANYVERKGRFDDRRDRKSIPSPYVMPFDKHIQIAFNHCSISMGTFNLGISGLNKRTVEIEKDAINKMYSLKVDKKWPMYRLNLAFKDYSEKIFSPLSDVSILPKVEDQLILLESGLFSAI